MKLPRTLTQVTVAVDGEIAESYWIGSAALENLLGMLREAWRGSGPHVISTGPAIPIKYLAN